MRRLCSRITIDFFYKGFLQRMMFSSLIVFVAFLGSLAFAQQDTPKQPILASLDFEGGRPAELVSSQPDHWRIVDHQGSWVLELAAPGEQGKILAPTSWALLSGKDVTSFTFMGRLKCNADTANPHRDLCVFFHFQGPAHFYYIHFSAASDEFHNIIGLVNGSDRIKINAEPTGKSVFRLTDQKWHEFKVSYDKTTGKIEAYLDDMETSILTAIDKTLDHGLVGVGSFDDTGFFDNLKLWGDLSTKK